MQLDSYDWALVRLAVSGTILVALLIAIMVLS